MNLAAPLLAWHYKRRRGLPWRAPLDERPAPYAVLVSEFMCQQTRVETAIPYFHRWMAALPTLKALAAASEDDVVRLWTGLGYYRRARNLRAAAIEAVSRHGDLPADEPDLRALPGIGPYTAGAIASIAFGRRVPLVDGNVARVLARLHGIERDVTAGAGRRQAWSFAGEHINGLRPDQQPGHWNEALMELGAVICTPRTPTCAVCPIAGQCIALSEGRTAELPVPRAKTKVTRVAATYTVVLHSDHVLVMQRPGTGRWAKLWEPPGFEGSHADTASADWMKKHGVIERATFRPIVHVLSHRRYEVVGILAAADTMWSAQRLQAVCAELPHERARWMPIETALGKTSGVSRLAQKLIAAAVDAVAVDTVAVDAVATFAPNSAATIAPSR